MWCKNYLLQDKTEPSKGVFTIERWSDVSRLDVSLVERGLAASRQRAQSMIQAGQVKVNGLIARKPAMKVRSDHQIEMVTEDHPWVGRGALKLLGVLQPFGVDAERKVCADFGASTGGFTQVLLEHGAQKVYAIDVGRDQLDSKLRADPRVIVMEETNVRHLERLPEKMDLIVGDLSFISLALVLPAVARFLKPGGEAVLLIKPQFEVGKSRVQKGGLVKNQINRRHAIERIEGVAHNMGFLWLHGQDCSVPGAKAGNVEYFTHFRWAGAP